MDSLGARFRRERERRGMSLDDVAVSTKISTRMLQALEDERYDQLPGGIFNKGFVRAYARHLELNEEQAVADYVAATGPPPVETQPVAVMEALAAHAVETRGEKLSLLDRIPWGTLSMLLLVVAIALTIWGPRPRRSEKPGLAPQSSRPAEMPQSAPPRGEQQAQALVPAAPAERAPSSDATSSQTTTSGEFSLRIQANEDSWLSITADGKPEPSGVLAASARKSVAASRQIVVKAGNVGALDFWFNGTKLAPQGDRNKVKTLTFGPSGLQPATARIPAAGSNP